MPTVRGCQLPDELLYDVENNIWYRENPDGTITLGMTAVAAAMAGQLVAFTAKKAGRTVQGGKSCATVEWGKWVGPAKIAFDADVVEVNDALTGTPKTSGRISGVAGRRSRGRRAERSRRAFGYRRDDPGDLAFGAWQDTDGPDGRRVSFAGASSPGRAAGCELQRLSRDLPRAYLSPQSCLPRFRSPRHSAAAAPRGDGRKASGAVYRRQARSRGPRRILLLVAPASPARDKHPAWNGLTR